MAIPKRHRRNIHCEGRKYHWYFPQGRDFDHRSIPCLIVQAADCAGQVLKVSQASWPDVTPAFVTDAIVEALKNGWRPDVTSSPFNLVRSGADPTEPSGAVHSHNPG